MSTSLVCPRCGLANLPGAIFCSRCAERLASAAQTQAVPGTQVGPQKWYEWQAKSFSSSERQGIDRTKTGLLLLIIGMLLGPIPYLNFIGGILAIVGAIMVILGREAFGDQHARFVIISLVLYLVGLGIIFVNAFALGFSLAQASLANGTPSVIGQAFSDAFSQFLVGTIIAGVISGVAILLFTYALQNSNGKILLWTGYATSIIIGVLAYYVISQTITTLVQQAASRSSSNPLSLIQSLQALQVQAQLLGLLGFIPAIINATAYYLVWLKIGRGELPEPVSQSSPFPSNRLGNPIK